MLPPLAPSFEAALRDVRAQQPRFRLAAAARLAGAEGQERGPAIAGLSVLAADPVGSVRQAALEGLGVLGDRDALQIVLRAFEDQHLGARQAAVMASAQIAPEEAREAIIALLTDERPELRFSAVWTLSRLGQSASRDIERCLRDEDPEVRSLTATSLAEIGASDLTEAVAQLLDDPFDSVRFAAAKALATLGDARGAGILRTALQMPAQSFEAAIALGDIRDQEAQRELQQLARRRFASPILRAAAARALVKLGHPEGERILGAILRSWRIEARLYAVELVGELGLVSLLEDLEAQLRKARQSELPVYRETLRKLSAGSDAARALLSSID